MTVVTDTHPWIWFFTGSPRLSNHAKSILSDRANTIIVPSIVMLEIKYLYRRKRITVSLALPSGSLYRVRCPHCPGHP